MKPAECESGGGFRKGGDESSPTKTLGEESPRQRVERGPETEGNVSPGDNKRSMWMKGIV